MPCRFTAYDADAGFIKHYRVDKMTDIETVEEERGGLEAYQAMDMSGYTEKVFGMFAGKDVRVRMRFSERLAGAVLDRLGMDAILVPEEDGEFTVTADVVPSPQFFAWLINFGTGGNTDAGVHRRRGRAVPYACCSDIVYTTASNQKSRSTGTLMPETSPLEEYCQSSCA